MKQCHQTRRKGFWQYYIKKKITLYVETTEAFAYSQSDTKYWPKFYTNDYKYTVRI